MENIGFWHLKSGVNRTPSAAMNSDSSGEGLWNPRSGAQRAEAKGHKLAVIRVEVCVAFAPKRQKVRGHGAGGARGGDFGGAPERSLHCGRERFCSRRAANCCSPVAHRGGAP